MELKRENGNELIRSSLIPMPRKVVLKAGDVRPDGNIKLTATSHLQLGIARVSLAQALAARKFGWRIVPGTIKVVKDESFLTVHVRRDRVSPNYL